MRSPLMNARVAVDGTRWGWIVCTWIAWTVAWGPTLHAQDTLLVLPADSCLLDRGITAYLQAALRVVEIPKGMYKQDLQSPYRSVTLRIPLRATFSYELDSIRFRYTLDSLRFSPRKAKITRRCTIRDTLYTHGEWIRSAQPTERTTASYHGSIWSIVHGTTQVDIELTKIENLTPLGYATLRITKIIH